MVLDVEAVAGLNQNFPRSRRASRTYIISPKVIETQNPSFLYLLPKQRNSGAMNCPLCAAELRKHLLSSSQAIISCPNESCVYPFNLPMEEIRSQGLTIRTNESEIMAQMQEKLARADIDPRTAQFMTKPDTDISP